jgi:addiction module RelE/StbE family toxin
MKIVYSTKAANQFRKLPKPEQRKARRKIEFLSQEPYLGKKLSGEFSDFWIVRSWPYRIMYQILSENQLITIVRIEHRQSVYKRR